MERSAKMASNANFILYGKRWTKTIKVMTEDSNKPGASAILQQLLYQFGYPQLKPLRRKLTRVKQISEFRHTNS